MPFLSSSVDTLKHAVHLLEASVTPRIEKVTHEGRELRLTRSIWWHDATQASFDVEIAPYFAALGIRRDFRVVVDAGAATGLFALAACHSLADCVVHAFEPSARQRILLRRNVERNGVASRVTVTPAGLWNATGQLPFRTHGAISSFKDVSSLPVDLAFDESVPVLSLDEYWRGAGGPWPDLIKMDIEGAEIEALQGARRVLVEHSPMLLIQAYHIRGGARTFEPCAAFLQSLGYQCREAGTGSGFLVAHRPSPDA